MRSLVTKCAGIALASALFTINALAEMARVDDVRVGLHPDRTRLVLDTSRPLDYRLSRLGDPARIVLDIENAVFRNDTSNMDFTGSAVQGLRHARRGTTGLRVVLDLRTDNLTLRRFTLVPDVDSGRGHRLVIDLLTPTMAASAEAAQTAMTETAVTRDVAEVIEAEDVQPIVPELADVDAVVLDSGAGGPGPGKAVTDQGAGGVLFRDPTTETTSREASTSGDTGTGKSVDESLDDFFSMDPSSGLSSGGPQLSGYFEASSAYTIADPDHWSKLRARLELALTGEISDSVRYKVAARFDADGAYVVEDDFYPSAVRDDQRFEAQIREFYLDFGSGAWTHRVGRQHIVWGEMVGLFLADVVSARDTREFYLQEFEAMRIPQWAWNAQYFAGDTTLEFVYIPFQSVDNIGEPGADFYPFPLPADTPVRDERPDRDLNNFNWGVRGSTLVNGWSLSAYYYDSVSVAPTLVTGPDSFSLQYDDLQQVGGTFSKDLGGFIFKGEAVYVRDRRFQSFIVEDPAALPSSAALDWVVGSTIPLGDWRVDLQLYGRSTADHDPRMGFDADEFGTTILVNYAASSRLEFELLALAGLNREDYLIRPKVAWRFARDWRLQAGADVFGGGEEGLFGPFDNRDRVYLEVKRWF